MENFRWSCGSLVLALIIGIVLLVGVHKKVKKQTINGVYALFFLFWLILLLLVHLASELNFVQPQAYFVALGYLHAPFFYFSIRTILRLPPLGRKAIYYHLIPLQCYAIILVIQANLAPSHLLLWIKACTIIGAFVVNYIYLFVAFRAVKKHQEYTLDHYSCQRLFTAFFTLLIGFVCCSSTYSLNLFDLDINLFTAFQYLFLSLIIGSGYYLIYQFVLKPQNASNPITSSQSRRSNNLAEMEKVREKLEKFMHCHKPFVRHSLTIYTLAEMLNQKPACLSSVIYQCYKKSFSEYINTYRVQYFIEVVPLEEHRHRNLLGIALEIGFNSKNTFLRAFKKEYHTSPYSYFNDLEITFK
mgnify:CR=1 FL=1